MDKLNKYLGKIAVINCDVELEKVAGDQNNGLIYRAEVNLFLPLEVLRVEKLAVDIYKAIDKVEEHLTAMIKKYKEKIIDKKRAR